MRALLDTNVLVSALLQPRGPSARLLSLWRNQDAFTLIISDDLLEEVEETLRLPRLQKFLARAGVTDDFANIYMAELGSHGEWVDVPQGSVVEDPRDPDDAHVLVAAVLGQAEYVVTGDKDLLTLEEYGGIKIATPRAFVEVTEGRA